jgi:cold shock CspA family protein
MSEGTITDFKRDRGFGFIRTAGGDVFVHASSLDFEPRVGQRVRFHTQQDKDGRTSAVAVELIVEPQLTDKESQIEAAWQAHQAETGHR